MSSSSRSLTKQINDALDRLLRVGQSRHHAKHDGTATTGIFAYRTRSTYGDRCIAAVKWIKAERRPDLRQLRDISHDDLRAYIAHCEQRGLAGGSIRSTVAALRKLEAGMRSLRWWQHDQRFIPPDLSTRTPRSTPRLGFSLRDAHNIIAALDGEAQLVAHLALSSGLRISEIARLREDDIDRTTRTILVRSGKGGRDRLVTRLLDPAVLDALPTGRNWLFDNPSDLSRRVEKRIAHARDELKIDAGTGRNAHSFRAAYAEQFIRDGLRAGLTENQARDALTLQLGHSRRSITYRYCPRLTARSG